MISAVQNEERAAHRQRTRSAASGPAFSVPAMPMVVNGPWISGTPPVGLALPRVIMPPVGTAVPPGVASPAFGAPDLGQFVGRRVGSGQCVALVQAVQPELGPTRNWTCGDWVQGNAWLQPGTPIATFDQWNRYANARDGSSHAAIYLGQNADGIQVLDQWAGKEAGVRTIPWVSPSGLAANTGAAYRVVVSA